MLESLVGLEYKGDYNTALPALNVMYHVTDSWNLYANTEGSFGSVQYSQMPNRVTSGEVKPEKARTWELGTRYDDGTLRAEIGAFLINFDNQYESNQTNDSVIARGETRHQGIETSVNYALDGLNPALAGFDVYASYAYVDATIREDGPNKGNRVPFSSKHKGTLGMGYTEGRWKLNLTQGFIALSTLSYTRWEDFATRLDRPLAQFIQLYQPAFFERILTGEVVSAVRKVCTVPLIVKLSPQAESIPEMCKAVEAAGADAISLCNTFQACAIDLEKRRPVFNNIFAGLSGPAVRPIALRMVWQAVGAVNIPVVGLGGIATGRDALEFIMAGAAAVQVGAANFANPRAMETIADEMAAWMDKNGVKTLDEIRGCARNAE